MNNQKSKCNTFVDTDQKYVIIIKIYLQNILHLFTKSKIHIEIILTIFGKSKQ